jgi:hypothetical protein
MHYRFVVRLLSATREVLAWNQIFCVAKGDGCLRATQDFLAEGQVTGTATSICVHWVDVHVHTTMPLPQPIAVDQGKVVSVPLNNTALFTIQGDRGELPGVTVTQSVQVAVSAYRG